VESGRPDIHLVVGGPGTREVLERHPRLDLERVELVGRVPQADVSTVLGNLHATVLARPPARYSRAGFPTKVVESLAVGTPVVCNLTGDLEDVVVEGETGWVATGPTVAEIASAVARAALTGSEDLSEMRARARSFAEARFDDGCHVDRIDGFLRQTG